MLMQALQQRLESMEEARDSSNSEAAQLQEQLEEVGSCCRVK